MFFDDDDDDDDDSPHEQAKWITLGGKHWTDH
jgi:hypothetical protein